MPDWLVENGIGESRAVRLEDGEIVEARIMLEGTARTGTVLAAKLVRAGTPAVATSGGEEYLLPAGAPGTPEGAPLHVLVTREAIPGAEPWKRPLARAVNAEPSEFALDALELPFPGRKTQLDEGGWADLLDEARSGIVRFAGGELRISPTPAMTLIDVDGTVPPEELALAGAEAAAKAIVRHGIGGSIGIDFPTLSGKAQRQRVGELIDTLLPQPFERTAMNGFGFLQIVRPRRYASTFELAADRPAFEARALLRHAALEGSGPKQLVAGPALAAVLESRPDWLERLARQVGGAVTLRKKPSLPIQGAYAENA